MIKGTMYLKFHVKDLVGKKTRRIIHGPTFTEDSFLPPSTIGVNLSFNLLIIL